ncbi:MAG: hypothetical protein QNK37_01780 [Acidobacteriota bacterium]|nr:hypothetical protein [Acidobacteriota bacterium]
MFRTSTLLNRKRLLWVGIPLACLLLFGFWLCPNGLWFFGDMTDYTKARRGSLTDAITERTEPASAGTITSYHRLVSDSGLEVEAALKRPEIMPAEPLPLVVLIGGFRTGRDAIDLIHDQGDTMFATVSYPYEGNRRIRGAAGWFGALRKLRLSMHDSPAALKLSLDFLLQQPGVDPTRVELVGVSLGSFLATVGGALDQRFSRVWCIHGGADYTKMLNAALEKNIPPGFVRRPVAGFGNLLVNRLDPKHYVGRISPREVVMVNAAADDRIPRAATDLLHARALEPKQVIWLDTKHVSPRREELIRELVGLVLTRIEHDRQMKQSVPDDQGNGARSR